MKYISQICSATPADTVYKDECVYSFDTPETETGLYVSLKSFLGFSADYVEGYYRKTGNAVFLHIRREKFELPVEKIGEEPEKKITRLAIGVEDGFLPDVAKQKYEYKEKYSLVVFPEKKIFDYPDEKLPLHIQTCVNSILQADSAIVKFEKAALEGVWDGEIRKVSIYAKDLKQLHTDKKIPPSGWKCEKCDLKNNLWLNLTDGSIMCGRKYLDGSGGNDHAVQHFNETGYPLAVKLGTITSEGKGDVYSYIEDDMVEDPLLANHLAHFGIKVNMLEKTERTMIELELDLNQKIGEWSLLTESSSNLVPISGPGYTGMKNLGNSCYLNSVMQVVFIIPDFIDKFVNNCQDYFNTYPTDPANDFNIQMCKLGFGLWSGKYSSISDNSLESDLAGISPVMFKNVIGKDHPDFSGKQQQDAQEFYLHLINVLLKNSRNQANPADALRFCVEDRVECMSSGKVKYTTRDEWCLPLPIPINLASNIDEYRAYEKNVMEATKNNEKLSPDSIIRPKLTLKCCLDSFAQTDIVEQFYSTAIKDKTTAKKTTRLATMPDFLMLHLKKFTLKEDWTSMKLDVSIDIPDILDLSNLRATGIQPNEEPLPDFDGEKIPEPQIDVEVLNQLAAMGFPIEGCKRAIYFTKNNGVELAMQWMMDHMTDSDFASPFTPPGMDGKKSSIFVPNQASLECLTSMGFTELQATKALKATDNNVERATDWIFSHPDEIDDMETDSEQNFQKQYHDGDSTYKLVAFISHMGASSQVGHYVCHILKDDQWVIFNDSKVAISQNPPREFGYLYLYKRL